MEDPKGVETPKKTYHIMVINMNGKGAVHERKELSISTIKSSSASVIFCQEAPGNFKQDVVAKCGNDCSSYEFVPEDIRSVKRKVKVAVMWRETDFEGEEVVLTEPSITKIVKRLKEEKSVADVTSTVIQVCMERTAMVKLTSKETKASFLAVSWHGPWKVSILKLEKPQVFHGLICFLREVCENMKLSWFIIGGDFNFNTTKVDGKKYGVTISRYDLCTRDKDQRGHSFVPCKDTFVFSVPSDKLLVTEGITVSSVEPLELENESGESALLDHVPVVGVLNLVGPYEKLSIKQDKDTFTEDANKSRTLDKTTNEKDRPEPTPEKTAGTAKVGSRASGIPKKLFEDASPSCSSKSPSVIPDGYVTREDFERLFSLVTRIEEKIDSLTAEVEELKLAPPKEQGSDRESTSLKKE